MVQLESCPVARTAKIVSGKWTLLILRDLAGGTRRFHELERSLSGISPKTLSQRLRGLEEAGLVHRRSYAQVPPRVDYSLTAKGQALIPVIEHMREYGRAWLGDDGSSPASDGFLAAETAPDLVRQNL